MASSTQAQSLGYLAPQRSSQARRCRRALGASRRGMGPGSVGPAVSGGVPVEWGAGVWAELVPAECPAPGLEFGRGSALHVPLVERRHEGLLAALVTAEDLGAGTPLPVLRHAQFQGAHAGDEFARIVAAAVG